MKDLRKQLMVMKKDITNDIADRQKREHDEHNEVGDEYDKASQEREREMDIILTAQEQQKLQSIDEAIKRMDEGTYGACEDCGEKISRERLKALPFATLCVNCKSKQEQEEGFFSPFDEGADEPFDEEVEEPQVEEEEQ